MSFMPQSSNMALCDRREGWMGVEGVREEAAGAVVAVVTWERPSRINATAFAAIAPGAEGLLLLLLLLLVGDTSSSEVAAVAKGEEGNSHISLTQSSYTTPRSSDALALVSRKAFAVEGGKGVRGENSAPRACLTSQKGG